MRRDWVEHPVAFQVPTGRPSDKHKKPISNRIESRRRRLPAQKDRVFMATEIKIVARKERSHAERNNRLRLPKVPYISLNFFFVVSSSLFPIGSNHFEETIESNGERRGQ